MAMEYERDKMREKEREREREREREACIIIASPKMAFARWCWLHFTTFWEE